jgi:hypothetical protein
MQESLETMLFIAQARVAVLMQVVRILFRDRAAANGHTPEEILKWNEELKVFFEQRLPVGTADAFVSAACDDFFNLLAAEVREDREGPEEQ